jgi:hypothetical protein
MVKKMVYGYLIIAAITLLLGLIDSLLGGANTDAGFLLLCLVGPLFLLLFYTSPIFLIMLVMHIVNRNRSVKEILTRAERFHTGNR